MVHGDIRNVKGGGVHYTANWQSPESRLFRAGLKHDPYYLSQTVKGKIKDPNDLHDRISYERGVVIHSRSSSNQYFNFHYMFGGFKNYVVKRWWVQHFYRKFWRVVWFPFLVGYGIGCWGMRKYDNAAYNFFYFSD